MNTLTIYWKGDTKRTLAAFVEWIRITGIEASFDLKVDNTTELVELLGLVPKPGQTFPNEAQRYQDFQGSTPDPNHELPGQVPTPNHVTRPPGM